MDEMRETMKLWNLGLTDRRTHNKLIIRVWTESIDGAKAIFVKAGLGREYELRYIREDNYFTKAQG